MTEAKKWDWRTGSKEMLAWIAEAVVGDPSDLEGDVEGDPIAVMGRTDRRSEWVEAISPGSGKRGTKLRYRPDQSRRYFISQAESPVANFFEKKKPEWSRAEQIDAFRDYVWYEWLQKGNMPDGADRWLRARAQEVIAGRAIDLVSESRDFSRKREGGIVSRKAPYDCHGHVVRALILIKAGQITMEEYFVSQANYLLKMEGDPIRWDRELKEIIAARKADQDDLETDVWS